MNPDDERMTGLYEDAADRGPAIALIDGGRFFLLDPDPSVMNIEAIAHALALLCRWTGHCRTFFSVAQHSVLVSRLVPPKHAMAGLMHDASEAFIGDISRPLKVAMDQVAPGAILELENTIHRAIADRYGFDFPHDPSVKYADNQSLVTEKRDLLPDDGRTWQGLPDPLPETIVPLNPRRAHAEFVNRFIELGGQL